MIKCAFVSDLHGKISKYEKLFHFISKEKPDAVFMAGDLLPHSLKKVKRGHKDIFNFTQEFLIPEFLNLKRSLKDKYPDVFVILGNDDERSEELHFIEAENRGIWHYCHFKKRKLLDYNIYGYSFVPPTPFRIKDWERYDVSRYVDPGCVHPMEGYRTVAPNEDLEYTTIKKHLEGYVLDDDLSNSVIMFHSPPYNTSLDLIETNGRMIDSIPIDNHVGSIAIREMIENKKPYLTLHGHTHESSNLSGIWKEKLGDTVMMNAAYHGPELSLILFDLGALSNATRLLI